MKYIKKGKQPPALIAIHKDKTKTYEYDVKDNLASNPKITVKSDTLNALIRDQGYICCYCMQKISTNKLTSASPNYPTIEHYVAQSTQQSKNTNLDTDYKNMLATCHGNDKINPDNKHCDSSRKDKSFKCLNPLNESCERVLGYAEDGSILCTDILNCDDINYDIDLLKLNFSGLKDARKSVIEGIKKVIKFQRNKLKSGFNKNNFKNQELAKCIMKDGRYQPYIQVKIYALHKLLG